VSDIKTIWDELAIKILSSILVDHGAYFPVADIVASDPTLWPPVARNTWKAIVNCVESDTIPTAEAVKLRVNGNGSASYIDILQNSWDSEDNAKIIYNTEQLKQIGLIAKLRAVGRELAELKDVTAISEAVERADVGLSSISALHTDRDGNAGAVLESAWSEVESFQGQGIKTGLQWFDKITGGLWPGFNYWVVAAYKSGKSTLARNIILNVAQAGHAVDFFGAEGSREMFTLDCVAMIASGLMLDRGILTNKLRLSGLFIKRAWRQSHLLTKDEYECIQEARLIWQKLPIRVWDSRDGIRDRSTVKHIVKRSKLEYGSEIYWYDYSQLCGNEQTIYDRQSNTALMVQDVAVSEKVSFGMLAQRNESAVKGDSGHSSGVKGGGDADAAADFTLIPSIDDNGYKVQLKHSRHTAAGMSEYHLTNPSSGLIIDRWINAESVKI
jgi:replicative DNA helicase